MAHTPGPWQVSIGPPRDAPLRTCVVARDLERNIATCHTPREYGPNVDQAEANARLIAAAPELLAALERIANYCKTWAKCDNVAGLLHGIACAAIAEATGEPIPA